MRGCGALCLRAPGGPPQPRPRVPRQQLAARRPALIDTRTPARPAPPAPPTQVQTIPLNAGGVVTGTTLTGGCVVGGSCECGRQGRRSTPAAPCPHTLTDLTITHAAVYRSPSAPGVQSPWRAWARCPRTSSTTPCRATVRAQQQGELRGATYSDGQLQQQRRLTPPHTPPFLALPPPALSTPPAAADVGQAVPPDNVAPRTIVRVGPDGVPDYSTVMAGTLTNNLRAVATVDGSRYWFSTEVGVSGTRGAHEGGGGGVHKRAPVPWLYLRRVRSA
jgi:hypothetical protein